MTDDDSKPRRLDFALFTPPSDEPIDRECPGGCGKIIRAQAAHMTCAECQIAAAIRDERAALEPALESIPFDLRWATLDSPALIGRVQVDASNSPIPFARTVSRSSNVTLLGPAGAGKTSIACAILRVYLADRTIDLNQRKRARFANARVMPSLRDRPELAEIERASVLVLDDVGGEENTATGRGMLARIISVRYEWARPTIITTAHDQNAVRSFYGDGIARRMFSMPTRICVWPLT